MGGVPPVPLYGPSKRSDGGASTSQMRATHPHGSAALLDRRDRNLRLGDRDLHVAPPSDRRNNRSSDLNSVGSAPLWVNQLAHKGAPTARILLSIRTHSGQRRQKRERGMSPAQQEKSTTQVDALAAIVTHPLRRRIWYAIDERPLSPRELADLLHEPVNDVAYHVRVLRDLGVIELAGTRPVRGATQHFYRADPPLASEQRGSRGARTGWLARRTEPRSCSVSSPMPPRRSNRAS